jgi:C4-type Zn-finger protein
MKTIFRPGRPKGSKTVQVPIVLVQPSACPRCGSTRRQNYSQKRSKIINGKSVVWNRTSCLCCGLARDDKFVLDAEPPIKIQSANFQACHPIASM